MNRSKTKNIIGGIICFLLSFLLGGIGMGIMLIHEAYKSEKNEGTMEKSAILRYVFTGVCGYCCNVSLIIIAVNELWIQ
ncbi:MAG: hypothetical protein PUC18_12725 [Prevotellaceae bacterium]|nr:hypothetical protein [Prevotellaceae bacterium]